MRFFDHIRLAAGPEWKVRLRFYWWVVRYGGKKRIPREVVLRSMKESVERMEYNLRRARDEMPAGMPEELRLRLRGAIMRADELGGQIKKIEEEVT